MGGISSFQGAKLYVVEHAHLAKDALHIYVALAVFFGACVVFRWKATQWRPLLAVLVVACAGEAWDFYDMVTTGKAVDFHEHIKDIANTVLAPTIIVLVARYSQVFRKG